MADPLTVEELHALTWYGEEDLRAVGIDAEARASLERRRLLIRITLRSGDVLYAVDLRGLGALRAR
jgi:hypothetical protein